MTFKNYNLTSRKSFFLNVFAPLIKDAFRLIASLKTNNVLPVAVSFFQNKYTQPIHYAGFFLNILEK